jgi:hypothetical protein
LAPADCQQETAIDVIIGPPASNETMCARDGQAYVAQTPFVVAGETYPKILCARPGERGLTANVRPAMRQ